MYQTLHKHYFYYYLGNFYLNSKFVLQVKVYYYYFNLQNLTKRNFLNIFPLEDYLYQESRAFFLTDLLL